MLRLHGEIRRRRTYADGLCRPACQKFVDSSDREQTLPCGHSVCKLCVPKLLRNSGLCPLDRKAIGVVRRSSIAGSTEARITSFVTGERGQAGGQPGAPGCRFQLQSRGGCGRGLRPGRRAFGDGCAAVRNAQPAVPQLLFELQRVYMRGLSGQRSRWSQSSRIPGDQL